MKQKYYWVNFNDESQMRITEKEGEALKKLLIENVRWVSLGGAAYNTNKIASVTPDYAEESLIKTLIPRV